MENKELLKNKILECLESKRGGFCSGEELAELFSVSRSAVWKAVKNLKAEGYNVKSVTNRGYCLDTDNDLLSVAAITNFLKNKEFSLQVLRSATSTNDIVKKLAESVAEEWTVVISEEQTAGRGRYNRAFYSPSGEGVYFSVLLRPEFSAAETLYITTSAAVAVCEAIESLSNKKAQIKWVNDVLIEGKKTCGILTEASFDVENGKIKYAVVGIGINVKQELFPNELKNIATSAFGTEYRPGMRSELVAAVLDRLKYYYDKIPQRAFFEEYKRRSVVIGKRVKVVSGNLSGYAQIIDLDENCFLKARFDDGSERLLSSGEVSVKL